MLLGVHLVPCTLREAAFKMKLNKDENYVEWHRPTICFLISDLTNSGQVQGHQQLSRAISHLNQTMPTLVLELESSSMCRYLALVERLLTNE